MSKLLALLGFTLTFVIAVAFVCSEATAQAPPPPPPKNIYATSVVDLNTILGRNAPAPNNLLAGDTVIFNKNVSGPAATPYIMIDRVAMVGTNAALAYTLQVEKSGIGTWRLDQLVDGTANASNLWATTANTFTVSGGTLELMQASSITLRGTDAQTRFVMADGTTLNSRGSSYLGQNEAGENQYANAFIAAPNIALGTGVSLGFDMASHNGASDVAVMRLDGNVTAAGPVDLNILGFKNQGVQGPTVTVRLLEYNYTGTAPAAGSQPSYAEPPIGVMDPGPDDEVVHRNSDGSVAPVSYPGTSPLLVRGETWYDVKNASQGRLGGTVVQYAPAANAGGTVIIALENFHSNVGVVNWVGGDAGGGSGGDYVIGDYVWNATSNNWSSQGLGLAGNHTFIHGDSVNFGGTGSAITIQEGGVQIGQNPNANGSVHVGMIVNSGQYTFSNADGSLIGIDGPGRVLVTGENTLVTFESANSYWGGTNVENRAQLTLHNSGGLGTGVVNLRSGAYLNLDTRLTNDTVFNAIVTEEGTRIYKDTGNVLTMEGTVSGMGDTHVREGVLRKNISQGVLYVYDGAKYEAIDQDRNIAGLSNGVGTSIGGTVDMSAHRLNITVAPGREYTFSGLVTGQGASVVKNGQGTQIFDNDHNTYTGSPIDETVGALILGTTVDEGMLVGKSVMNGDITNYTPFGTGAISLGTQSSGGGLTQPGVLRFDLQADPGIVPPVLGAQWVATLNNQVLGAGDLEVGVDNPASATQVLHLTNANSSYTGKTVVRSGALRVSNANATGQTSVVDLRTADTQLQFINRVGSSETPYDRVITGDGGVEVLTSTSPAAGDKTVVYMRGYNFYQLGQEAVQSDLSDYTGATVVNANSELHLLDGKATGETAAVNLLDVDSALFLDFGSVLDGKSQEVDQIYNRFITGLGSLTKNGDGTAVLAQGDPMQFNDYTGLTTINRGSLKLMYAGATGKSMADGGSGVLVNKDAILELAFDGLYGKDITGQGILAKSGIDTTSVLGGFSTYSGGTRIYGGTLSYNNLDANISGNLGTGGVLFQRGGGALQNRGVVEAFSQQILIDAGSTATFDTLADLTIAGTSGISHQNLATTDPYYNADDTLSHLVKTGSAKMTINSMAAWSGTTTVKDGILANNIPTNTALTVEAAGTYFTGNANRQVSALLGTGTIDTVPGFDFTVNNAEEDTFDGTITGGGKLVKTNVGTLILTGINSYTGGTHVQQGTLVGSIADNTDLTVDGLSTYQSGGQNRVIGSLQGSGTVDMQNAVLTLNQTDTAFVPEFAGTIQNGSQLIKLGSGTQALSGLSYRFSNNVTLHGGFLKVGGSRTSFQTDGNLLVTPTGGLYLDQGATMDVTRTFDLQGILSVNIGNNIINVGGMTIGDDAVLNIAGVSNAASKTVVVRSKTEITDDFDPANVFVAGEASTVDFLEIGVGKSADKKEIYVGQTLAWYKPENAHGNFTLQNPDSEFTVDVALNNVTGTFDPAVWDGKTLTKKGRGKLVLAVENGYTGQTRIEQGTLKLTHEKATAGSEKIVLHEGATLEIDFNSVDALGNWSEGMMTSITDSMDDNAGGDLVKSGVSVAVLGGASTFTGQTYVNRGALLIDGSSSSRTWVRDGAGFGGDGTVNNSVSMEDGSYYHWRFDGTELGSDHLTVVGGFYIGDDVTFKPVTTVEGDELVTFDSRTVVTASEGVFGRFAGINANTNPFYRYELDYSDSNAVKITGYLRDTPHALSDVVATSLMSAQKRMYRTAYQQIGREWLAECLHPQGHAQAMGSRVRGQAGVPQRTAWMNLIGRGEDFASSFHNDTFELQSYGVQTGISLVSNCTRSLGIMYGREENTLRGGGDEVKGEDNYLGFYYGQVFASGVDVKTYIGGGWQKNDMTRLSNGYRYLSRFNGNTFNLHGEFGRRFVGQRNWLLRPFVGMDLSIAWVGKSLENSVDLPTSLEYRGYERASLTQFFFRFGAELMKSWRRVDFRGGTQFRWNVADTKPWTDMYYPALNGSSMKSRVRGYGAEMGACEWGINVGLNWFLTERRNTMFFLDYDVDLYFNRDAEPTTNSGTLGFVWRF